MKNCLIIINSAAGNSKKITFEKVEKCLGEKYAYTRFSLPENGEPNVDGYDAVAVCGGDGTLSNALALTHDLPIDVFYFPAGTLNDRAKATKRYAHARSRCPSCAPTSKGSPVVIGKFSENDGVSVFSYVLAAGSFTPIGYAVSPAKKRKLGVLAYIFDILKEYRVHRIPAAIDIEGKRYEGEFTLIMFLKSPRCFGFGFNKAFDAESESGHLVAIRAPKRGGLLGMIQLFFPFFRVFFLGLKKERDGKIIFKNFRSALLTQGEECVYCRDGERQPLSAGTHEISFAKTRCAFYVIDKFK